MQGAEFMLLSTAPTEANEGIISTVNGIVDHHVGARNQNQVFQKSSQCSYLLNHLSSPHAPFLPSQIFTVGVRYCATVVQPLTKNVWFLPTWSSLGWTGRESVYCTCFSKWCMCVYLITSALWENGTVSNSTFSLSTHAGTWPAVKLNIWTWQTYSTICKTNYFITLFLVLISFAGKYSMIQNIKLAYLGASVVPGPYTYCNSL